MECDRVSESFYDPPKVLSRLDLFARMGFIGKWVWRDLNPDHSGDVTATPFFLCLKSILACIVLVYR